MTLGLGHRGCMLHLKYVARLHQLLISACVRLTTRYMLRETTYAWDGTLIDQYSMDYMFPCHLSFRHLSGREHTVSLCVNGVITLAETPEKTPDFSSRPVAIQNRQYFIWCLQYLPGIWLRYQHLSEGRGSEQILCTETKYQGRYWKHQVMMYLIQ